MDILACLTILQANQGINPRSTQKSWTTFLAVRAIDSFVEYIDLLHLYFESMNPK